MIRSCFVTTLGAIPDWPVIERVSRELGIEPKYDGRLGDGRTNATVQITLAGSGEADGIPIGPGQAVIMDGAAHPDLRYRARGRWEFIYFNLVGARSQISALVAERGHVVPFPPRHPFIRRWLAKLDTAVDSHLTLSFSDSHRVASEVLTLLTATASTGDGIVERALTVMADGWNRNLGLRDVAQLIGVSPEHLSRLFHRETGETPAAWYRRHRLERAKDLLRQTDTAVLAVADACGFTTSAHFVASFRSAFATTPSRWRQAMAPSQALRDGDHQTRRRRR